MRVSGCDCLLPGLDEGPEQRERKALVSPPRDSNQSCLWVDAAAGAVAGISPLALGFMDRKAQLLAVFVCEERLDAVERDKRRNDDDHVPVVSPVCDHEMSGSSAVLHAKPPKRLQNEMPGG